MMDFQRYEEQVKDFIQKANVLWNKVTILNVAEILEGEVDLRAMDKLCMHLSSKCSDARRAMSRELEALPDEEFDQYYDAESKVDGLFRLADDKFSVVDNLITRLKSMKDEFDDDESAKHFTDVQTINLGESIVIQRFK